MFSFAHGVVHFLTLLQIIADVAVGLFAIAVGLAAWAVCHWWCGRKVRLTPEERASLALFGEKGFSVVYPDERMYVLDGRHGLFSYNDVVAEFRESAGA